MLDFLDTLRQKPEPARVRIAVLAAALVALVVFAAWATAFLARQKEEARRGGSQEIAAPSFSFPSPFQEFEGVFPAGDNPENL